MAQSKILVDTNSYLRLAKTVRPLLFSPFGGDGSDDEGEYCLYILPELNKELQSHRLISAFLWIEEEEYHDNRQHFPTIGRKVKKSIDQTLVYLWEYVQTDCPGPSKVDALYIAYALELDIPVVTDDQDMVVLAEAFDCKVMSTLGLLKVMLNCDHVDMKTIQGLVDYWRYIGDRPANLEKDFKRLFL